jgi:hypothetical protein
VKELTDSRLVVKACKAQLCEIKRREQAALKKEKGK